ncbi:MAG: hypothetical protein L0191_15845, partial [Acidobacteria bacterium]|nr:hypothetical protein [Acidobacteriota bacterium]
MGPVLAQQHASSLQSYHRARRALDAGIVALGGLDKLRGIQTISVRHQGQSFWRNQSPKVSPPFAATPTKGLLVLNFDGTRVIWDNETSFPGGFLNRNRLVVKDKEVWSENHVERRWTTVPAFTPANQAGFMRRFPHYILLNAFDRAAQLRWLGEANVAGKKQDVITYSTDDGQQLTLYLDARTHLFTKWEQLYTDPQTGDALLEVVYAGYQEIAGVKIPTGRRLRRAGETAEDVSFTDVEINREIPERLLQKPS